MLSRNWWVTSEGGTTIGPVSTELLIEGIKANKVPHESVVCEVGGSRWRPLGEITELRSALTHRARARLDEGRDRGSPSEAPTTRLPLGMVAAAHTLAADSNVPEDHTVVTSPPFRISDPPSAAGECDEQTLVDVERPTGDDDHQS